MMGKRAQRVWRRGRGAPRVFIALGGVLLGGWNLGVSEAAAQYPEVEGLREAVDYYHEFATSDLKHLHQATSRLEAVAIDNPVGEDNDGAWLAAYWTSFVYTQLALFANDERSGPYVRLANAYYDKAFSEKPDAGPEMDADFHALKAMLHSFDTRVNPGDAVANGTAADEEWAKARAADPDNPMALMNQGLGLIPNVETRAQAYEILDQAIESYEHRLNSVRPNWGREFIDVWMGNYPRNESSRRDRSESST